MGSFSFTPAQPLIGMFGTISNKTISLIPTSAGVIQFITACDQTLLSPVQPKTAPTAPTAPIVLSSWAIVGIVVGVCLVLCAIGVGAYFLYRKLRGSTHLLKAPQIINVGESNQDVEESISVRPLIPHTPAKNESDALT